MEPFLFLPAFVAVAAVLLWSLRRRCKKERLSEPGRIKVCIIVKDQELWIEGFVRKLCRVVRGTDLKLYIVDDCSCDHTTEILQRLGKIYSLQVLSAADGRGAGKCRPSAKTRLAALRFDVRGLKGRALLNAPLFCHLSRLSEGKSQVLSK